MDLPLGVAAAAAAALFFATADFSGAVVSRRATPLSAAFSVQLISGVALAIVLVATAQEVRPFAVGIGLIAGLGVAIGLLALYEALSIGAMGVVAVLTGVVASALTLAFDILVAGRAPSALQLTGMACAIAGAAVSARLGTVTIRVAVLSLVVGCAFGASFIAFNLAAGESLVTVLFAARLAAIVLLGAIWALRPGRRLAVHPLIALAGALDTAANLLIMVAVSLVPVSLATAISSADPPIIIMFLARSILGEGLPRLAYLSVALGCAGIGLMILG
ncbi:MAG: EamA family transporter [Chloroflexota bacterium]